MEEFKRYSLSDLGYGYNFGLAIKYIDENYNIKDPTPYDFVLMNETIKFANDKDSLKPKYAKEIEKRSSKIRCIRSTLGKKFNTITSQNIIDDLNLIITNGKHCAMDYFETLCDWKAADKIDAKCLKLIFEIIPLYLLLEKKDFAIKFAAEIKNQIINDPMGITYVVSQYDDASHTTQYYLPNFSDDEINGMIKNYLNIKSINPNTLSLLKSHKNNNGYIIHPKTMLLIGNKFKEAENDMFKESTPIGHTFGIEVKDDIDKPVHIKRGSDEIMQIPSNFLFNFGGPKTTLEKLTQICNLTDRQGRLTLLSNIFNESTLTLIFMTRTKNQYTYPVFEIMERLRNMLFNFCYSNMTLHNGDIEGCLEWAVNFVMVNFFNVRGIMAKIKCEGTYSQKCEILFNQISCLLKQYQIFVDNGFVTPELYNAYSYSYNAGQVDSLIKDKYVELNEESNEMVAIIRLLFSDQSTLNYISKDLNEHNFYDLITKHELRINDFNDYQLSRIRFLAKNHVIDIKDIIKFKNEYVQWFYREMKNNRFILYPILNREMKISVQAMIKKGWVKTSSKLFSKYEADYMDYYLNNSKFDDALALRNLYEHGNGLFIEEERSKNNYLLGLKIFTQIVLKIFNDLKLKEKF